MKELNYVMFNFQEPGWKITISPQRDYHNIAPRLLGLSTTQDPFA